MSILEDVPQDCLGIIFNFLETKSRFKLKVISKWFNDAINYSQHSLDIFYLKNMHSFLKCIRELAFVEVLKIHKSPHLQNEAEDSRNEFKEMLERTKKEIKEIKLVDCGLDEFCFKDFKRLEKIEISNSTELFKVRFPGCNKLQVLALKNTGIVDMPKVLDSITSKELKVLDLSFCSSARYLSIPKKKEEIFMNLEKLDLSASRIVNSDIKNVVNSLHNLKELSLDYVNGLKSFKLHHKKLEKLSMSRTRDLTNFDLVCPSLKELNFCSNPHSSSMLKKILINNPSLTKVDFSYCWHFDELNLPTDFCSNIEELNLNYTLVGGKSVSDAVLKLKNLKKLMIRQTNVRELNLFSSSLQYLDASFNGIEQKGIIKTLENCSSLEHVILSSVELKPGFLVASKSLKTLNLHNTRIRSDDVTKLVKNCPKLGTLQISLCNFPKGDELTISSNSLQNLIMNKNGSLASLTIFSDSLKYIDFSECINLKNIKFKLKQLERISVANSSELISLELLKEFKNLKIDGKDLYIEKNSKNVIIPRRKKKNNQTSSTNHLDLN